MKINASEKYVANLSHLIEMWKNVVYTSADEVSDDPMILIARATLKSLKDFKTCITLQDKVEDVLLTTKEETAEEWTKKTLN